MTTNAKIGFGSLFEIFDNGDYVTVGEVTNITPPPLSRDAHDATHTESTEGWREFIPGLKNAGEIKIEMNFVPSSASDALIREQFDSDSLTQCRIKFPAGISPAEALTLQAIVTNYETTGPIADKMSASLTLKVSGKPTWGTV